MIKDLMANGTFIICFLFLAGQIFKNNPLHLEASVKVRLIAGIFAGLVGTSMMLFSIRISNTIIVNMLHMPVIMAAAYCGMIGSVVSASLIIVSQFLINGLNDVSITAAIYLIILSAICGLISKMGRWSFQKKYWLMNIVNLVIFCIAFFSPMEGTAQNIQIYIYYVLISLGVAMLSVYVAFYIKTSNELFRRYREESKKDFLTGLNNVRQFDELFNSQLKIVEEGNEKLSVLFIDVDHFKKVNDTYGHAAGDLVLKELGMLLKSTTRAFDIISRNGGEEFSVVLPDCPYHQALEIAERIRSIVEKKEFQLADHQKIHITVSIGVAAFPETTECVDQLLDQADRFLNSAKRMGRNQVCSFGSPR